MTYVKTLIALIVLASSTIAQTPTDYNEWKIDDTTTRVRFGAGIQNYPNTDSTFAEIDNTLLADGDSVMYNNTSVLKTRINKSNGVATVRLDYDGTTYEVEQKPMRLIWLNVTTKDWFNIIPSLSWPTPTVDTISVKWDFPGFDYSVIKRKGQVFHKINFGNAFLDSATTLFDQRADTNDIALGIVHRYSLTNIDDSVLINIANVDKKKLIQFLDGNSFDISKQWLQYDSSLENPDIPVNQRWIKLGEYIYMVEYTMMKHIKAVHEKYPTQDIWHYATDNFGRGTDESESSYTQSLAATTNYGTATQNQVYRGGDMTLQLRWGSALNTVIDGVTINSATVYMKISGSADNFYVFANEMDGSRDWVELEVTYNIWKTGSNWTTGGGLSIGNDILDTARVDSFSTNGLGVGDECNWDVAGVLQDWADDITTNQGWNFFPWTGAYSATRFHSDDAVTASNRPYLEIDYTSGAAPTTSPRRRKVILRGEIDYEKDIISHYLFTVANSIKQ